MSSNQQPPAHEIMQKYLPTNQELDPPWRSHDLVGRCFIDSTDNGCFFARLIVGYSPLGATNAAGDILYLSSRQKTPTEMFICHDEINLEPHELPGSDETKKWILFVDGFIDKAMTDHVKLSTTISNRDYTYTDKQAVLYQANHLLEPRDIRYLDEVYAIHKIDWINLGFDSERGLFEFIPPDEWKAIKVLFPQFSIYETACGGYDGAAGNIISNELVQFPLSVLDGCSMYPRKLVLHNSHTKLFINMINLQNVSRWGDIPSHVTKFDNVLKLAFPDIKTNGIKHLLSMPNTILLAITSAEQLDDTDHNVIGIIVFTLPPSVNNNGRVSFLDVDGNGIESCDKVESNEYQPIGVHWLHVQGQQQRKGAARLLLECVGLLGRFYGLPYSHLVLTMEKANNELLKVYTEKLKFQVMSNDQHSNFPVPTNENFLLLGRRGTGGSNKKMMKLQKLGKLPQTSPLNPPDTSVTKAKPRTKKKSQQIKSSIASKQKKQPSKRKPAASSSKRAKAASGKSTMGAESLVVDLCDSDSDSSKLSPPPPPNTNSSTNESSAAAASSTVAVSSTASSTAAASSGYIPPPPASPIYVPSYANGVYVGLRRQQPSQVTVPLQQQQPSQVPPRGREQGEMTNGNTRSITRPPSPPPIPAAISGDSTMSKEGDSSFAVFEIVPGDTKCLTRDCSVDYPVTLSIARGKVQYKDNKTTSITLEEDDRIVTKPRCVWQMTNIGDSIAKVHGFSAEDHYKMGYENGKDSSFAVFEIVPGDTKCLTRDCSVDYPVTLSIARGKVQYKDNKTTSITLEEDDRIVTKPRCVWQMTNIGDSIAKVHGFSAEDHYKMGYENGKKEQST